MFFGDSFAITITLSLIIFTQVWSRIVQRFIQAVESDDWMMCRHLKNKALRFIPWSLLFWPLLCVAIGFLPLRPATMFGGISLAVYLGFLLRAVFIWGRFEGAERVAQTVTILRERLPEGMRLGMTDEARSKRHQDAQFNAVFGGWPADPDADTQLSPQEQKHLHLLIETAQTMQDAGDEQTLTRFLSEIPPGMLFRVMEALGRTSE